MSKIEEELIVNIAHLKCFVKMNEVFIDKYTTKETKATKATKELLDSLTNNNNKMREIFKDIDNILHEIYG